ncbi:predicted protein [Naegleria gruberi]|uniref:Predicted protein n=1 Tax=Naegleria gruberi TaxID=5762 RepID=D2V6N5_NAEGR|nr:uncharacterized protein NAEGRDRAFT_64504 [Naegleria gruberi]EFC47608.1 predicted protein [Naegleria gruberi]|eukprot:XP_002680352.1 predicted protein [Naegleria gruberi strain NEG-M]
MFNKHHRAQSNSIYYSIALLSFCAWLLGTFMIQCTAVCTNNSDCGVRKFLADLKTERGNLMSSYEKLSKGIALLNSTLTNSTTIILNTRVKQLDKLKTAISSLDLEISAIDARCATTVGMDCDSCADGYTNFPTCNVPTCFGISSTNKSSVCSGRGSCISPNTCNCTSPYYGSYCQNTTCTSLPTLIHKYQLVNSNGQDDFGLDLTAYGTISYSSTDVPNGAPKSVVFNGVNTGLSSTTNIAFGPSQTLALWMKKNNANTGIAWSVGTGGPYIEFSAQAFSLYAYGNTKLGTSDAIFTSDVWHHIALVFKTSTVDLYVDGALQKTFAGAAGSPTNRLVFGCYGGACASNYYWAGSMANILYFNSALNAAEVQNVYKATLIC